METTEHYGLKQPGVEDFYDVQDQNENMAAIDSALHELETGKAALDPETKKVKPEQLPNLDYIPLSDKGAPGGVAALDETGKLSPDNVPGGTADAAVQAHNEDLNAHAAAGFFRAVDEEMADPVPVDADMLQGHTPADFRPVTWVPTAEDVGAAILVAPVTVTVDVAAWTGSGPWEQTVSVAGVTAEDEHLFIGPVTPADRTAVEAVTKAYNCITPMNGDAETVDGGVKLTCYKEKPEVSFQITIKGVR
ncbi:hypothetical protein AAEU42_07285 [Pseudoflavonifractor phocaeensis]|uniref:hypothetical protein n=1 Tax=Pseudoflavonifractor phocaeensis TaxID=1870988 RepID=UPI00313CCBE9